MEWGTRARLVVVTALVAGASSGCGVAQDYLGAGSVDTQGAYVPLTKDSFAAVMTDVMFDRGTAHMDMDVRDETMSMDLRFDDVDEPAMTGTYDDGKSVATMVLLDGEVYVREESADVYFQLPDYLADQMTAEMDTGNPAEMAADLESGLDTLTFVGSFDVEYGQAHRYDLTFKKEYLADELGIPVDQVPDVEYRMWLDDEHLVRRMDTSVTGVTATVEFSAWGEPVEISAPPPDQVEPLPGTVDDA